MCGANVFLFTTSAINNGGACSRGIGHGTISVLFLMDSPVASPNTESRLIERLLGVHVELYHVHEDLHVALGLHERAHHAETAQQLS